MLKSTRTQKLVRIAVLAAVTIILATTSLGYIIIPFTPLSVTIMVLPIVIGGLMVGFPAGLFLGALFGITSFLRAPSEALSQILYNQNVALTFVVCVVPRLLIGVFVDFAGRLAIKHKKLRKVWFYSAVGLLASLLNTVMVLGGIALLFDSATTSISIQVLGGIVLVNGLPEAAANAVLAGVLVKALTRKKDRVEEDSASEETKKPD